MTALLPLRIVSGWAIVFNNLVDLDHATASAEQRAGYFGEDLLSIVAIEFVNGSWRSKADGPTIDVGWGEGREGTEVYLLRVIREKWDDVLVAFEERNRVVLARALEMCMELLGSGMQGEAVQRRLDLVLS